jgi:hypothetical protein
LVASHFWRGAQLAWFRLVTTGLAWKVGAF